MAAKFLFLPLSSAPSGALLGLLAALSFAFGLPSCQAHGKAGAGLNLDGAGHAGAEGEAELTGDNRTAPEPTADKPPQKVQVGPVRMCGGQLEYEGTINFAYNSDQLEGDGTFEALTNLRDFLSKHGDIKITVEGHTDSRGSSDYNRALSKRRAASVRTWLIEHGIASERVESVGHGEDKPKVEEPAECLNKVPADKSPCEEAWATNRRSVFAVVGGGESVSERCGDEPEPEPEPVEPPKETQPPPPQPRGCPTGLAGVHLNALGPNSWLNAELAIQPLCWLELSGGIGFKRGDLDAPVPEGRATGSYRALTIPVRGRIWFFDHYSPVIDLGTGLTWYGIEASSRAPNGQVFDYTFAPFRFIGFGGIGFGYRSNGPFRVAGVIGGLVHTKNTRPFYSLSDARPWGEVSFGFLF